ncbi:MAG: hypothetical protein WKF73_17145 [Nocardioidaceae bacterium]
MADDRLEGSAALSALRSLLGELDQTDRCGRWGRTFALRDQLRRNIASSPSSEGMDHRDWALWWALLEELDRLQALDVAAADSR